MDILCHLPVILQWYSLFEKQRWLVSSLHISHWLGGWEVNNTLPFNFLGCLHELCTSCALYLCSTSNITSETAGPPGSIPCPLCRHGIVSFVKLGGSPAKEFKLARPLSLCTPCMLHTCEPDTPSPACRSDLRKNRVASVTPELLCPLSCAPFPSVSIPSCTCNEDPCHALESSEEGREDRPSTPHGSGNSSEEQDSKLNDPRLEKTSCSIMFWGRRSCHREHQCNSEINAWCVTIHCEYFGNFFRRIDGIQTNLGFGPRMLLLLECFLADGCT